jgi:catechol 2,3-dioxygenase-like lactoylglutathione lyase family enzyme
MRANGIHHLAISTADIKQQIEFFTDVLGCELVALYWMHGVEGAWHGFLRLNDHSYIAFVEMADNKPIESEIGVTHAGWAGGASVGGTMQHVSFNVDTYDDLLTIRDRIRDRGLNVFGPLDHGMCHSIYFAGHEDLSLEVSTSEAAIDQRAWIDPEVVELAGITPEELDRYRQPAVFERPAEPVPQPEPDPDLPHPRGMNPDLYQRVLSVPDEIISAPTDDSKPPVSIES